MPTPPPPAPDQVPLAGPSSVQGTVSGVLAASLSVPFAVAGAGLVGLQLAGTGLAIPCPMNVLFGAACPFCGTSRAAVALVRGDGPALLAQAPAVAIVVAIGIMTLLVAVRWLRRRALPPPRAATAYLGIGGALLVANWVWQLRAVGFL